MDTVGSLACTGDGLMPLLAGVAVVAAIAAVACIVAFVVMRRKR